MEKCVLKSCDADFGDITLWNDDPYILGRSRDTKIKDKKCSKQQIEVIANLEKSYCSLKRLGSNFSALNSEEIPLNSSVKAYQNDVIEVLSGKYPYKVEFFELKEKSDNVEGNNIQSNSAKRSAEFVSEEENPPKKVKKVSNTWVSKENGNLLIYNHDSLDGSKIAAYDMDGTLIVTKSGKVFAVDYNDWQLIYPDVPDKLKSLYEAGYKIVIFTNQGGIESGKQTVSGIQGKISRVIQKLGVPVQAFVSTGGSKFRKPAPFMWKYMQDYCNDGKSIDMESSFYVGDAAGRIKTLIRKKKDHSLADRHFALNVAIQFLTPEEHFRKKKSEPYDSLSFDPLKIPENISQYEPSDVKVPLKKVELVVMVGFPGSGKSYFASNILSKLGYKVANRDTLGTWQKCASIAEDCLKKGQSVVIDNTNPDKESRSRFIKIAASQKVPVRCFIMNVSKDQARHNNKFRELIDTKHVKIKDMIFNMYNAKYKEPEKSEGFTDIVKVNFKPNFKDSEEETLYKMHLLEK